MKKSVATLVIGLSVGLGLSSASQAEERAWNWSPLGIGLAAPIQLPYMSTDIYGLRIGGFLGYNADVYGLDVGVTDMTAGDFAGLQAACFTWTEGKVYGAQFGAVANVVRDKLIGFQAGCVNVDWGEVWGLQVGCVNYDSTFLGIEVGGALNWNTAPSYGLEISAVNANQDEFVGCALAGLVNYAEKTCGFSCAPINVAYEATGCQLGVVNACDRIHGVQIGLVNMICESKLPIMVLMNASF